LLSSADSGIQSLASYRTLFKEITLDRLFASTGDMTLFGLRAIRDTFRPPFELRYLIQQLYEIGVGSLLLIITSGFALGVVMSLHTRGTLVQFGAEAEIPIFQSMAFFNEIGPLVAALLVAGRVGAGMGAQLANMRATEQIDAIETLSVDSFKLLVVTRVIACTLMLPVLTIFIDTAGVLGGYLSEHAVSHLSWNLYLTRAFDGVAVANILPPTLKTAVFGYLIATISCFYGYTTNEGSEGVRRAATNSVVISSLVVILADVILVKFIFFLFPDQAI
jgi:phospholipid/cholesterol/gamma-HCH transport system permease protein